MIVSGPAAALALEATVVDVRARTAEVRATLELKDVFEPRFQKLLEEGGTLHLRVEAELWEDRPAWDRLVRPPLVTRFRIVRDAARRTLSLGDPIGGIATFPAYPNPLPISVDVAPVERIEDDRHYYLHAVATIGAIAEREIDEVGEAVFGRDSDAGGLGTLGKFVFRKILEVGDYLQSVTTTAKSRRVRGREIKEGRRP